MRPNAVLLIMIDSIELNKERLARISIKNPKNNRNVLISFDKCHPSVRPTNNDVEPINFGPRLGS